MSRATRGLIRSGPIGVIVSAGQRESRNRPRARAPMWMDALVAADDDGTRRMVMEDATFDAVTQRLGMDHSRRRLFGGLIAAVAGLTGAAGFSASDAEAKRRHR